MEEVFDYQMTNSESQSNKLKNALYNLLLNALSENEETRRVAEEKIKAMEITEEFGVHLIELSLQKDLLFAVRQMASILLKQYIDNYWHINDSEFVLISNEIRPVIRKQLLEGLREPHSKIRNGVAFCVSYIGSLDWPIQWPALFEEFNDLLASKDDNAVTGVIRVYEELTNMIEGRKAEHIAAIIFDQLCLIFEDERYKPDVRMLAIHVMTLIVNMYNIGRDNIRQTLLSKLPSLCGLFVNLLQTTDKTVCDYGLKTNIIRFLTLLVQRMSKCLAPFINGILPTIWSMVMNYGVLYTKGVIYAKMFYTDLEDDEGKVVGFTPLVLALFDFIHSIVDCPRFSRILVDVLPDILYYDMIFMQITKKMEEIWVSEPMSFIEDDSSKCFDTTVRVTAKDVFMMICHDFDANLVVTALCHTVNRHLSEAESSKQNGTCYWWKVHEVSMYTLGLVKNLILPSYKNNTLDFNLISYIEHWQIALQHSEYPLLLGRCIWFGGKYSSILPVPHFNNYMQLTLSSLRHNEPILRVSATRTVMAYCEEFSENPNKSLILLSFPTMLDSLIENVCSNYIFPISLKTMHTILSLNENLMASSEHRLVPLLINLFLKHNTNPEVIKDIKFFIKDLIGNVGCSVSVHDKFVPMLASILNGGVDKIPSDLQAVAMDILQTIIRYSKPPLTEILLYHGFPAVIKCILQSDDQMLLQSGCECLRCYLLLDANQIQNFTDSEGETGYSYVFQATSKILDPLHSEDACVRVGRLIITLINKAGSELGSSIQFLLRAILSKMQRVELMEAWQSLLIVFVYLFYTQMEAVISFLTSIPGPTGVSAFEFVLVEWFNRQTFFFGLYERIISIVALTKLLEYSVTSDDDRFDNINVGGKMLTVAISDSEKEYSWTKIPLLAKAFKIILNEIAYQLETREQGADQNTEQTQDDSSDDGTLTSQISDYYHDTDPDQYDPLYVHDPIFQIDILSHMTDFVHKFKTVTRFQWFVNYLSTKEKRTLASLGIFV